MLTFLKTQLFYSPEMQESLALIFVRFCWKWGVKLFVYASSSSVYGDHPNLQKIEGIEGNILSPYALTKRVDEEYAKLY